jgi:DinB superfamily
MPTPDELRSAIAEGRAALKSAISAAAAGWERVPAGEGEAGWSARQAAEHVIPTEAFFTTAVCAACGYPGLDEVKGDYPTAAAALTHLDTVIESCNKLLKHVSVTDLEKKHEKFGSAQDLMAFNAKHLNEHAAQIRAAAGV